VNCHSARERNVQGVHIITKTLNKEAKQRRAQRTSLLNALRGGKRFSCHPINLDTPLHSLVAALQGFQCGPSDSSLLKPSPKQLAVDSVEGLLKIDLANKNGLARSVRDVLAATVREMPDKKQVVNRATP
jgi:hypothetical protein